MSIAQSIREAALSWPLGFLGDVESDIIWAFMTESETEETLRRGYEHVHGRTFALIVAEALSEDIPRGDLMRAALILQFFTDEPDSKRLADVLRRLAGEGK